MKNIKFQMKFMYMIVCIAILFLSSCRELFFGPEKIYPQSITIPGYGKLLYTSTLFDGKDIKDTIIDGEIIWSLDYFAGKVYRYDNKTKRTVTLDIEKQSANNYESVYSFQFYMFVDRYMSINNDYILVPFVVNNENNHNYTVKINRIDNSFSYNKMPDIFDNMKFWDGFFYDGTLYFRVWDENPDVISYTTSDFKNFSMITKEEFWSVAESMPVYYYSDSKNRLYDTEDNSSSRTETYLCVSIDNGNTWYKANMGTNYANRVTSAGDTIYVSCHSYYEVIGFFPIGRTGGGVHIFQWEYE